MIRYQLQCNKKHVFEAWFSNSEAYEKQSKRNLITCPQCGSSTVSKAIMAPNISIKANRKQPAPKTQDTAEPEVIAPRSEPVAPNIQRNNIAQTRREAIAAVKKIREIVAQNAEYVGPKFAEEARKIHYEEVEEKGIYGEASTQEVRELLEEGIEIQPLPILPEEQN